MSIEVKHFGLQDYLPMQQAMREYTLNRDANSADQLWVVQHPAVFTQGQAGKAEHCLNPGDIPVLQSDRGGQITYHGPGQLVVYTLFDLKRMKLGVRCMVSKLEQCVIDLLAEYGLSAVSRKDAPGVYINDKKICSVGLRVRKGCSYHGLALNIDMDLQPFSRINPCGYADLQVTQVKDLVPQVSFVDVESRLIDLFYR